MLEGLHDLVGEMEKKKILVCGQLNGKIDLIYKQVSAIQSKHGPFTCLLCIGQFFETGEELLPYIQGEKSAPIPTYFLGTDHDYQFLNEEQATICENIHWLGKTGLTNIAGLSIGFFASSFDPTARKRNRVDYDDEAVSELIQRVSHSQFKGIDILLSNEWPCGILNELSANDYPSSISLLHVEKFGVDVIAKVASSLVPRYHFASNTDKQFFYERKPYSNGAQFPQKNIYPVSRFFSIGNAFNTKSQRFLYAFNVDPISHMDNDELLKEPMSTTEFPYTRYKHMDEPPSKIAKLEGSPSVQSTRFMSNEESAKYLGSNRKGTKLIHRENPDACWFCLEDAEKHLIVTVGQYFYIALAKGGINPYHCLIVSILHKWSSEANLFRKMLDELLAWKKAITMFFNREGFTPVFYEHYVPRDGGDHHMHIQVIPVAKNLEDKVKRAFEEEGGQYRVRFKTLEILDTVRDVAGFDPYIAFQVNNTKCVYRVDSRIPFHFGRTVLANLLGVPERSDWKACVQPRALEESATTDFRNNFAPFNFALSGPNVSGNNANEDENPVNTENENPVNT
eukprot:TRINITY_DN879_c0_g2_i2.p1 TRINITY_DN879_c0_g2~~TRINITY_DN879_c0_g2_i2.p1  ORF type:complete len:566 (-),score=121.71 TRINITY_DN879_c0_g2_i2:702-2399(-)